MDENEKETEQTRLALERGIAAIVVGCLCWPGFCYICEIFNLQHPSFFVAISLVFVVRVFSELVPFGGRK